MLVKTLFLTFVYSIQVIFASKILLWMPTPSISHQVIAHPIAKELSLRGHQVYFITPNPIKDSRLKNLTEIDVSYSYKTFTQMFNFAVDSWGIGQYKIVTKVFPKLFIIIDEQLEDVNVRNIIFNQKYDLVIVESCIYEGLILLKQYYDCPIVSLASLSPNRIGFIQVGDRVNPAYESHFLLSFSSPRTIIDKLFNAYFYLWESYMWHYSILPTQIEVMKKHFGKNISDYNSPLKVDLILANVHFILNGFRPNLPNVIGIGGIHRQNKKGLPQEIKSFLESSHKGVIYFSLGSNVKSKFLPPEKIDFLIEVFKTIPYKVLWKFEDDNLPNKPKNVFISKWLPQVDVLEHPNVKVFITQGGIQSLEETIHARKPIIGMPFFGDQLWNIDYMVNHLKIGVGPIDLQKVTKTEFINSIETVINNKSLIERVNQVANMLEDVPISPLDNSMFWIEYVIKHNGSDLFQSPALNLSWFEYLCVDIVLITIFGVSIAMFVLYKCISFVFTFLKSNNKLKTL